MTGLRWTKSAPFRENRAALSVRRAAVQAANETRPVSIRSKRQGDNGCRTNRRAELAAWRVVASPHHR